MLFFAGIVALLGALKFLEYRVGSTTPADGSGQVDATKFHDQLMAPSAQYGLRNEDGSPYTGY